MALQVKRPMCEIHPDQPEVGKCGTCNKSVCRECVEAFGYYCSEACRKISVDSITAAERNSAANSKARYEKQTRIVRLLGLAVLMGIVGVAGYIGWRMFLDKSGTLVWRWDPGKAQSIRVLGRDGESVVMLVDDTAYWVAIADGREMKKAKNPDLAGLTQYKLIGGDIVGWSSNRFYRATADGKNGKNILFKDISYIAPVFSKDYTKAWYMVGGGFISAPGKNAPEFKIAVVDLTAGKEVRKKLSGVALARIVGSHNGQPLILVQTRPSRSAKTGEWSIRTRRAGKSVKLPLPGRPVWGPKIEGGWMMVRVDKSLHVVNLDDGRNYKYSLPISDDSLFSEPGYRILDDQLLIAMRGGTACYGLSDGKPVWKTNMSLALEGLIVGKDRLITLGSRAEDVQLDLKSLPGGANAPDDLLKDFGGGDSTVMKRTKYVSVLAAVDRETGELLWSVDHVPGQMVADENRIAFIMDPSVTGFNPLGKEISSSLYVRQFSVKDGGEIVNRQTEGLEVGRSYLFDNRVINISGGSDLGVGLAFGQPQPKPGPVSVYAIKLR